MTNSWHPAAITAPLAAAVLAAATSWAVTTAGPDQTATASVDLQHVKVHRLERAIDRERDDIQQLQNAVDRTKDHIERQKQDVAAARAAAATAGSAWSGTTSGTTSSGTSAAGSATSSGGTSGSSSAGSGSNHVGGAPAPQPNTTTGGS